ncbi:hypothetical protein [Amycolatopsis sp. NPDC058986]|uniref:hypothetical protein n=1 Tax=unclassified Amycolatopsis TaxID=2618356 RepID=UPI00366E971A
MPRHEIAPVGQVAAEPKRLAEQVEHRTLMTKAFPLSDGRTQLQVSQTPLHYRDAAGHWQDIDTRIAKTPARQGYAFGNEHNTFRSSFGTTTENLVGFAHGEREIRLGIAGAPRALEPRAEGSAITYPGAFPGTDVVYQVIFADCWRATHPPRISWPKSLE